MYRKHGLLAVLVNTVKKHEKILRTNAASQSLCHQPKKQAEIEPFGDRPSAIERMWSLTKSLM